VDEDRSTFFFFLLVTENMVFVNLVIDEARLSMIGPIWLS
jgi:hypothetical protein